MQISGLTPGLPHRICILQDLQVIFMQTKVREVLLSTCLDGRDTVGSYKIRKWPVLSGRPQGNKQSQDKECFIKIKMVGN